MPYFRWMENVFIRDAQEADLKQLLVFEQELIKAERPFDVTIKQPPVSYYDIAAYIQSKDVKLVVAEQDGMILSSGYAIKKEARAYLDHKTYGYLGFMYTLPEFRGRGINQLVVNTLVKWCKENGLKEIRLTVYDENESALKAYQKAGFKKHICEMRLT